MGSNPGYLLKSFLLYQRQEFGQKELRQIGRSCIKFLWGASIKFEKSILSSLAKNLWKFLLAILIKLTFILISFFSISYSQWTPHWCHTCSFGFKHFIAMVGQKKNSGAVHVLLSRLFLDFILILSWFYSDEIWIKLGFKKIFIKSG